MAAGSAAGRLTEAQSGREAGAAAEVAALAEAAAAEERAAAEEAVIVAAEVTTKAMAAANKVAAAEAARKTIEDTHKADKRSLGCHMLVGIVRRRCNRDKFAALMEMATSMRRPP